MASITSTTPSRTAPPWALDGIGAESLIPGGARLDATQFAAEDAVVVTVGAAGALANATSVPVAALGGVIPSGATLDFGGKKFARLTVAAAAGATSLTVAALPTALVEADAATYAGTKKKLVPAGTLVGRTFVERAAGTGFGVADVATPDDELYLTALDVFDVASLPDVELYLHGGLVRETALPNWATLGATAQAKIRALYQCII
jgi:hypothetical protein